MKEYHKIQTIFKRDMANNAKTLLEGKWTMPEFEYLANNRWVFTEKVDGTNIRIIFKDGKITIGGKSDSAQIHDALLTSLKALFLPMEEKLQEVFGCDACLYGEGYGAKIQGGGKYRKDQSFVLFDVSVGDFWLQRSDTEDIAMKLGIDIVPIIGEGTLYDAVTLTKAGITSKWGKFQAEGIVARPKVELSTRRGERIITKIKSIDFK